MSPESVPSEKNVPSILAAPHPRTPKGCNVGCQQGRIGDRFHGAKKSFLFCLSTVFRNRQHCKGGAGWPQPRDESGGRRGDVFFARDGKGFHSEQPGIGVLSNFACALEVYVALSPPCKLVVSRPPPHIRCVLHASSRKLNPVYRSLWIAPLTKVDWVQPDVCGSPGWGLRGDDPDSY